MSQMANSAEGTFTFIDTPDTVIDAFGGAIGSLQGNCIRNVCINLNTSSGVTLNGVSAGIYQSTISTNRQQSTTTFAQMYPGERRTILLNLSIPAVARGGMLGLGSPVEQDEKIFSLSTQYTEGSSAPVTGDLVECIVSRLNSGFDDTAAKDLTVDAQINNSISTQATKDALALADRGRFDEATTTIRNALATIRASSSFAAANNFVLAAVEDLEDALRAVSDRHEYERGGRAEMTECYSKCSAQRSHYTKKGKSAAYQSTSSASMQHRAMSSKLANKL